MYFDRFDIVAAHYAFCVDYHGGQWTGLYARLCRIGQYYSPASCDRGFESLNENGQAIYRSLEVKHNFTQPIPAFAGEV